MKKIEEGNYILNGKLYVNQLNPNKEILNQQIFFSQDIKSSIIPRKYQEDLNFNSQIDSTLQLNSYSFKIKKQIKQQNLSISLSLYLNAQSQSYFKKKINNNNLSKQCQQDKCSTQKPQTIFHLVLYLWIIIYLIQHKQLYNKIKITIYPQQNKFVIYQQKEQNEMDIDYLKIVDQILKFLNKKCSQMKAFIGENKNYIIFNQNENFLIGKGSFGKVYKGLMINKQKIQVVAIKMLTLSEDQYQKQGYIIEFSREQSILKRIRQSKKNSQNYNIVKLYDKYCQKYSKHTYIILQFCNGVLANKWIKQNDTNQKKQKKLFYLIKQIAKALYYLHFKCLQQTQKLKITTIQDVRNIKKFQQTSNTIKKPYSIGIIHRDIKPSNVIVQQLQPDTDSRIKIKIIDFGLARATDVQNFVNFTQCGTMAFQALQVARKKGYNATVDVYSLAVMILQMLSEKQISLVTSKEVSSEMRQKYQNKIFKIMNQAIKDSKQLKYFWKVFFQKCLVAKYNQRWSSQNLLSFVLHYQSNQISNRKDELNFYCLSQRKGVIFSQIKCKYYQIPLANDNFLSQNIICSQEKSFVYVNCQNIAQPHQKIILKVIFNNTKNKITIQQIQEEKKVKKNGLIKQQNNHKLNAKQISQSTIMYHPNTQQNIYGQMQRSYAQFAAKGAKMMLRFQKVLYSKSNFEPKLFKVLIFQQGKFTSFQNHYKQISNNYQQQLFMLRVFAQLGNFILNDLKIGVHGHINKNSIIIKTLQKNKFQAKLINFQKFFFYDQVYWGLTCYSLQKQTKKQLICKVLKHNRIKDLKALLQISEHFHFKQLTNYSKQKQIISSTKHKAQIEKHLKLFIDYCQKQQKNISSLLVGKDQILSKLQIANKLYLQILRYYQKLKNQSKNLFNVNEHNEKIFLALNLTTFLLQNLEARGLNQFQKVAKQRHYMISQKLTNITKIFLNNNRNSSQNYQSRLNENMIAFKSCLINQQKKMITSCISNVKLNIKNNQGNQQIVKITKNIQKLVHSLQQIQG